MIGVVYSAVITCDRGISPCWGGLKPAAGPGMPGAFGVARESREVRTPARTAVLPSPGWVVPRAREIRKCRPATTLDCFHHRGKGTSAKCRHGNEDQADQHDQGTKSDDRGRLLRHGQLPLPENVEKKGKSAESQHLQVTLSAHTVCRTRSCGSSVPKLGSLHDPGR